VRLANPEFLWALLALPAIAVLIWWTHYQKIKTMKRIVDSGLWSKMLPEYSAVRGMIRSALWLLAFLFLIFAIVDPQIGTRTQKVQRKGVDIIVALDVSRSMLAQDIPPSRMQKAKYQIRQMIEMFQGDRVGLIAFAGLAHPQCPLTVDYAAAVLFLRQMDAQLIPVQGTAIGDAIRLAGKMFKSEEKKYKVLILFSDGEDLETEPLDAARDLAEKGVIIHAVGVGTTQGGPIPYKSGVQTRFKKDKSGAVVITKLADDTLREIAQIGDGLYINVDSGTSGLEKIYKEINSMQKKDLGEREFSEYEDRFQGFALMALLLLVLWELISRSGRKQRREST